MPSSPPRPPGRPRSERARRAALEAARALLADRGLAATSVDAVCARAGISKATVYRHWGSKEQLCTEAVAAARPGCPSETTADARADLVEVLARLAAMTESSQLGRLLCRLVGESVDAPELTRAWRETIVAPWRGRVDRAVARGVAQGELRADTDVDLAVDLLVAPFFYRRLVTGTAGPDPQRLVDAVWAGFAAHGREGGT